MPNPDLWRSCHMPLFPLSLPGAQDLSSGGRNYNSLEAKKKLHFSLFSNSGYSRPCSIYQPSPHSSSTAHPPSVRSTNRKQIQLQIYLFIFLWRQRDHNLNKQHKNSNQTKLKWWVRYTVLKPHLGQNCPKCIEISP